jgi:hypothetical protein
MEGDEQVVTNEDTSIDQTVAVTSEPSTIEDTSDNSQTPTLETSTNLERPTQVNEPTPATIHNSLPPEVTNTPVPMDENTYTQTPIIVTSARENTSPQTNFIIELLAKARQKIQSKRKVKLDKIMNYLAKNNSISNDEVEKLLHVSDATATRYLEILEKEGKLRQIGSVGKSVRYEQI